MRRATKILSQIVEAKKDKAMLTVSQIMEAVNNRGEPRKVQVTNVTPLIGVKSLSVRGQAMGEKLYPVVATFYNVDYSLEKDDAHPLRVVVEEGRTAWMQPISQTNNPVQVRCQCPDYRHTYAHWNKGQKVLAGRAFPHYERKTAHMLERNPNHVPGVCKHLVGLFERLKRDRILS